MKKALFTLITASLFFACKQSDQNTSENMSYPAIPVTYPATATEEVKDNYFGNEVADPYRWLEVDTAAAVEAWVAEQNKVTFDYLSKIPFRDKIRQRLEELYNYPKFSAPFQVGEFYFFSKNDGLQNQPVIYRQKGLDGQPEEFIDPNKLSKEGTTAIGIIGVSKDDKYIAISRQDAGSDWQQILVYEVANMKKLPDELKWVKFSGASFWKDGFFYSRYPEPAKGTELSGNNLYHSVYYHKLGDPQSKDKLIYEDRKNPNYYHFGAVSEDEKYFILYQQPGTDGFATLYKDLEKNGDFSQLFEGYKNKSSFVHNIGSKFLILTDIDAPNYRLIEVNLAKPGKENWKDIIPESENLLENCNTGGGKLFAGYLEKATNRIYQMNYDGTGKTEIKLPGVGTAGAPGGREDQTTLFYGFTSYLYPPTIFKYDVASGKSSVFQKTTLKFNPDDYTEKQVTYTSKDGTPVTMFLVHKKDLKMDGSNPAYLYGYGGFNISLKPSFNPMRFVLLENNGVFAVANLRGGGEYGEKWHQDGMLLKKQNVFDDFIAAAEYLIAEKYTSKERLGIVGGSNGGLLVGACMNQRPDLFAVAFPAVGVMDMLRYHKFTVGKGWIPEYGCADSSEVMFNYLKGYSPLHNLKSGTAYPATMITTADHDDRVVPAHSFKYAATLQKCQAGEKPSLIRIETSAGHGAGKPTSKIIDEEADRMSFFFYNTNSPVKYLEN
jgi:prolyl oligopeptidase